MNVPDYRLVPLSTLLDKSGEIVTRDMLSTFVPLTDSSPSQFLEDNVNSAVHPMNFEKRA